MASGKSTPRSRSRSRSSMESVCTDTTMQDAPPSTPAQPRNTMATPLSPAPSLPASKDPAFSLLLSLPRELRDRVYMYALTSDAPSWWPTQELIPSPPRDLAPALLRTCKMVYHEAAPILYSYNKFFFTHPSDCNIFRVISSEYSELIRAVCFRIKDKDVRLWTAYLGSGQKERSLACDLPKLRSLWIFLRVTDLLPLPANQQQFLQQAVMHMQQLSAITTLHQIHQAGAGNGQNQGQAQQNVQPQGPFGYLQSWWPLGQGNGPQNGPQQQAQHHHHHHHHQHGNPMAPPNPTPHPNALPGLIAPPTQANATGLLSQLFNNPHAQAQAGPNGHAQPQAQAPPAPPTHPLPPPHLIPALMASTNGWIHPSANHNLLAYFLRRTQPFDVGTETLCHSLSGRVPENAEVKLVCIMKVPRPELELLQQRFASEVMVERDGDDVSLRTKFRKWAGVEVSVEVGATRGS